MPNKEITVGTKFQSRMECFNIFKDLIKEGTFCLLNENTQKVPLNKVNELIKENYIYLYIMDEIDEENQIENIDIRDLQNIEATYVDIDDPFFDAQYVFLCKEEDDICTFLGLYKYESISIDADCIKWKKQPQNKFILDKISIKKRLRIDKETIKRSEDNRKIDKKELALKTLGEQRAYEIKNIEKSLRKDKDIIEAFWNTVKNCKYGYYYNNLCLIISIDKYGDNIIDEFFKKEKKRHNYKIKSKYKRSTEIVQFYKSEEEYKNKLEKFTKDFEPIIILIGQQERYSSIEIKNKYKNNFFIEVYSIDTNINNAKLITKDVDKIINFLRVMTYNDTTTMINTYIRHGYLKNCLEEFVENKNIEIKIYKGTVKEIKKQIEEIPRNLFPKMYMVQIVYNKEIDEYTLNGIYEMLNRTKKNKLIKYYSQHKCNIKDIEMIIVKTDLK